jgi:hypothetical protein
MAPPNAASASHAASAPQSLLSWTFEVSAPTLQQPAAAQTDQLAASSGDARCRARRAAPPVIVVSAHLDEDVEKQALVQVP